MRRRKPEISEHAVAHEFRDMPVIAFYGFAAALAEGTANFAHILGIEPDRERGRIDNIAEQDRQMSPLGAAIYERLWC